MQALSEYIKALALFMIFSALVDIISPESSFKKYINLILGLMLIAFILEPLAGLVKNTDGVLSNALNKYQTVLDKTAARKSYEDMEYENARAVTWEYKKRLNEQIKDTVTELTGAAVTQSEAIVNEDYKSPDFGSLNGIHITVSNIYEDEEEGIGRRIAFGNMDSYPKKESVYENTEKGIKKCLSDFYNIDQSNIHITVR